MPRGVSSFLSLSLCSSFTSPSNSVPSLLLSFFSTLNSWIPRLEIQVECTSDTCSRSFESTFAGEIVLQLDASQWIHLQAHANLNFLIVYRRWIGESLVILPLSSFCISRISHYFFFHSLFQSSYTGKRATIFHQMVTFFSFISLQIDVCMIQRDFSDRLILSHVPGRVIHNLIDK